MGKSIKLAPIVIFVYNRPIHTRKTIEALIENYLSSESDLYIFSDGPRDKDDIDNINLVRNYIKTIKGFKNITIFERDENLGLAKSIINGVSFVVNKYGEVIVLEDDIVTSPYFLKFMNEGLDFYQHQKKIWHISGWNYPIDAEGLEDVFFWKVMNCWGWATWSDRWNFFEKDPDRLINQWSGENIKDFDLDGSGIFWSQVLANQKKVINTWAIFWYATIYENNGICVNPSQTYVTNIGHDGSGIHCKKDNNYFDKVFNLNKNISFSSDVKISNLATKRVKKYYKSHKKNFFVKVFNSFFKF